MRIIIQKTKRRKTENGFEFNETPQVITLKGTFPETQTFDDNCTGRKCGPKQHKLHLCDIPFGKYYSECEVKNNPCIPNNALKYKDRQSE
ncbi:MAG: hypothetical protein J5I47_07680 [Vicingus serpentipes]|nr:hypothetical protein [Vicingus serpentipes]